MEKKSKIAVAGGQNFIGQALLRQLERQGYSNVSLEFQDKAQLAGADYIFLVDGKSGGIQANQDYPAELMFDNLLLECRVIHEGYLAKVKKLLFMASSCCYPRRCAQPMKVEALLTGELEPTNEAYAVAKIAGIKLCQAYRKQYGVDFITAIPANPFGPGEDFGAGTSHVIPALIRKMHEAKTKGERFVEIWGSGNPRREFIFSDDLADAAIFVMNEYDGAAPINLGSGVSLSIRELGEILKEVVGFAGELNFNTSKPDGMPLKTLDTTALSQLGWRSRLDFHEALAKTYDWFLKTFHGTGTACVQ